MYVYTYIYTYIYTWTRALTRLETGRQVALKECAEKVRWLGTELELERSATATVSPMISYGDCRQVRITRPFGCPLLTCAFSCDASNAWPLGPAAFFREVRKNRTMTYGSIWSQKCLCPCLCLCLCLCLYLVSVSLSLSLSAPVSVSLSPWSQCRIAAFLRLSYPRAPHQKFILNVENKRWCKMALRHLEQFNEIHCK